MPRVPRERTNADPQRNRTLAREPAVTLELALRVADRLAQGLPIRFALALEPEPVTPARWAKAMAEHPRLSRLVDQRLAELMQKDLEEIALEKLKTMPAKVWILERRYPEYFGTKAGTQVNVQVNTVVGLGDDVLRRAAKLVSVPHDKALSNPRAGQFRSRKQERQYIVDVTDIATPTPTTAAPTSSTTQSQPLPASTTPEPQAP